MRLVRYDTYVSLWKCFSVPLRIVQLWKFIFINNYYFCNYISTRVVCRRTHLTFLKFEEYFWGETCRIVFSHCKCNVHSLLNVPDEGYCRNASCARNMISTFLFFLNNYPFHTNHIIKFGRFPINTNMLSFRYNSVYESMTQTKGRLKCQYLNFTL